MNRLATVLDRLRHAVSQIELSDTERRAGSKSLARFYAELVEGGPDALETYQNYVAEARVRQPLLEFAKQHAFLQDYTRRIVQYEKEVVSGTLKLGLSELNALLDSTVSNTLTSLKLWLSQFEIQAKLSMLHERVNDCELKSP